MRVSHAGLGSKLHQPSTVDSSGKSLWNILVVKNTSLVSSSSRGLIKGLDLVVMYLFLIRLCLICMPIQDDLGMRVCQRTH